MTRFYQKKKKKTKESFQKWLVKGIKIFLKKKKASDIKIFLKMKSKTN